MAEVFSERGTVDGWLRVEAALARAQADHKVMPPPDAARIAAAADLRNVDLDELWAGARNVGYPILTLVRQISAALPQGPSGKVHLGATTQDIMDTGRVLQLKAGLDRLAVLLNGLGDAVAVLVERHRDTEMAARTHAQQAVPTTLGQLLSTLLAELTRHRARLAEARPRIEVVSLFGAGGTSAAMGPAAADVRREVAGLLGLGTTDVSWHPARDGSAEFAAICAGLAATCGRLARNVIDLSRTEIGELREPGGRHRGASSTMPHKANPTWAAAVIGMSGTAAALASAAYRAMEVPQERASGEWQIEWVVLPQLACLAAGALARATDIAAGLRVDERAMAENLRSDGGLILAEAYMMRLAPVLGRERAHDLVTGAAERVRGRDLTLADALRIELKEGGWDGEQEVLGPDIEPGDYVGTPELACAQAVRDWRAWPEWRD
jgi:3-carboxy-cis,cis-muconate cycloisomerase